MQCSPSRSKERRGTDRREAGTRVAFWIVGAASGALLGLALRPAVGNAHEATIGLSGKKIAVKTAAGPQKQKFSFRTGKDVPFVPADPIANGSWLLVRGIGAFAGKTELIELDPGLWKAKGNPPGSKGYRYRDRDGTRGGVTKVVLKSGGLKIAAKGPNWQWNVTGPQDSVWVHFRIGEEGASELEWYCAEFGGVVQKNEAGEFRAKQSPALVGCPTEVCGNGELEIGEECDDGNLNDSDGCNSDCTFGPCVGPEFGSTMEAIQTVVFDSPVYSCNTNLCHDADGPQGGLDLSTLDASHANLVNVASTASTLDRVEPGEQALSFLYEKLAAATLGTPLNGGSPMPTGASPALSEDHLEAIKLWIRGGAPKDGVVAGTADLLGGCLPEPGPLTIPRPDPPSPGVGVQIEQTPWPLPQQFEDEICMATYYDLTQTSLVPASAMVECPPRLRSKICDVDDSLCHEDSDCPGTGPCVEFLVCEDNDSQRCVDDSDCAGQATCVPNNPNNPSNLCFAYNRLVLAQDPQSHHSFVRSYQGYGDTDHPGWGSWTYKFQDGLAPHGDPCDPLQVDSSVGYNPGCSSEVQSAVSCILFGPPDLSFALNSFNTSNPAPTFIGSQEPLFEVDFASGVYSILPMQGITVWNSHAFNLTSTDSTMSQYLNIEFAGTGEQQSVVVALFDSSGIWVQDVPPFETREYCRTYTLPLGARLFQLTSHTHQWGVRWRTWLPPNTPCVAGPNESCGSPRPDDPAYFSTEYSDPLQLNFEPPLAFDSPNDADRTLLYCSLYDNGSTPSSPPVKQRSTSAVSSLPFLPGGPCTDATVACLNGPNIGALCGGDDSVCDSFPGAGDGSCDACPVVGGVTTTDEMFILIGAYYVP